MPEYNNVLVYTRNEHGRFIGQPPYDESDTLIPDIFRDLQIDLREVFEE